MTREELQALSDTEFSRLYDEQYTQADDEFWALIVDEEVRREALYQDELRRRRRGEK